MDRVNYSFPLDRYDLVLLKMEADLAYNNWSSINKKQSITSTSCFALSFLYYIIKEGKYQHLQVSELKKLLYFHFLTSLTSCARNASWLILNFFVEAPIMHGKIKYFNIILMLIFHFGNNKYLFANMISPMVKTFSFSKPDVKKLVIAKQNVWFTSSYRMFCHYQVSITAIIHSCQYCTKYCKKC